MNIKKYTVIPIIIIFISIVMYFSGCGGKKSSTVRGNRSIGKLQAVVSFSDTKLYKKFMETANLSRIGAQNVSSGTISILIKVTGYTSDNTEFSPISAETTIDVSVGSGKVTIMDVPVGVNHLLTAVATFPDGATRTVKTICPEVKEGIVAETTADKRTTVIAEVVQRIAAQNNKKLSEISEEEITTVAANVDALNKRGISYEDMIESTEPDYISLLLEYEKNSGQMIAVIITPDGATVSSSSTVQFNAKGKDNFGLDDIPATFSWTVNPSTLGTIATMGDQTSDILFTGGAAGSGTIVVTAGNLSATASITVSAGGLSVINIVPSSVTLASGKSQQFSAAGIDSNGNSVSVTPTWSVSGGVGTIDSSGLFTATTAGTGSVVATSGNISATATITTTADGLAIININPSFATVISGLTQQFTATGADANSNLLSITPTWSVIGGIGTVDSSGLFTASTAGTGSVVATSGSISATATISSIADGLAIINISPSFATVTSGLTQQFTATGADANGNSLSVTPTWNVSGGVGTIDSSGLFTASTAGTGSVVATSGSISATASITTTADGLATISISPSSATVTSGLTQQFTATGADANSNPLSITPTWSVIGGIGTVDSIGLFTASTAGTGSVVATSGSISATASITTTADGLATISISPSSATFTSGLTQQFTSTGADANGNSLSVTPTWSVSGGVGTIDSSGLFTATVAGTGSVIATSGSISATATITTTANELATINISPSSATVTSGLTQQFTATGADANSNPLSITPTWSVIGGVGTVDSSGFFTASTSGTGSITAESSSITATAAIIVNPGTLASFTITGIPSTATASSAFTSDITVTAYDTYGNVKTDYAGSVWFTSSDTAATLPYSSSQPLTFSLSDAGIHVFSASTSAFTLNTAGTQTITVTNGTISKTSDDINVSSVAPSPYLISAGYTHTCAILNGGSIKCWGQNDYGQLGDGTNTNSTIPVPVSGITNAISISSGGRHICALLSGGTIKCWGYNTYGQLGDGTSSNSSTPVSVLGTSNAVSVTAGWEHTCALLSDSTIKCWGYNTCGILGDGTTNSSTTPVSASGISNAAAVAPGYSFTCALLSDSTIKCWGCNGGGELGDGTNTNSMTPVSVSGISNATAISAGAFHICALLSDGTIKCWGYGGGGELGDGTNTSSNIPVSVSGISNALSISSGRNEGEHTCVKLSDGTLKCWGYNGDGRLGDGTNTNSSIPVSVIGISNASIVAAGSNHTCALLSDGTIKCWGSNTYGQLGDATTTNSNIPVNVIPLDNDLPVANAGADQNVTAGTLVTLDGSGSSDPDSNPLTYSWSQIPGTSVTLSSSTHQMPTFTPTATGTYIFSLTVNDGYVNSSTDTVTITVNVPGIPTSTALGNAHSCVLLSDGAVKCWGYNGYGQLGNGTNIASTTPISVTGISNATSITAGMYYTCVLLSDNTIKCWGRNDAGQLGNGTTTHSNVPVSVSGISTAVKISAGGMHTCAVLSDGLAKCWGWNANSMLGNGLTTDSSIPVSVNGISTAVDVAAGYEATCILLSGGSVKCWGGNYYGGLGNGVSGGSNPDYCGGGYYCNFTPQTVTGITTAAVISAGNGYNCAVLSDGTAKCWGKNEFGNLGDGTTTHRSTSITVSGLSSVNSISCGEYYNTAVLSNGTIKTWGKNNSGQLGDGTTTNRYTPVSVSGITNAIDSSVSIGTHACAVLSDGSVKCWGSNTYGQLGDGTTTNSYTPVSVSGF